MTTIMASFVIVSLLYNSSLFKWGAGGGASLVPDLLANQPHTGQRRSRIREDRLGYADVKSTVADSNCSLRGVRRFPSALIIGVRKGGTRALIDMLKCHPEVVSATNEIHYFDRDENFDRGVQWYIDQMPHSGKSQITIEKSPSYFVTDLAVSRIYNMSPNMKIILIIRNPLDRTISDYIQLLRKGKRKFDFEQELFLPSGEINSKFSPLTISTYDIHFEKWLKYFSLEQIHIVDGDALIGNPANELAKTEDFLEIGSYFTEGMFYFNSTKGFYCWKKLDESSHTVSSCLGSAKGHTLPQLSNSTVHRLTEYFKPHNERFFSQIQRRFSWDVKYSNIAANKL